MNLTVWDAGFKGKRDVYKRQVYGLLENHDIDLGFVYHHLHFKNIVAEPVLREKICLLYTSRCV